MAIRLDIQRTKFYNEISPVLATKYFDCKRFGFLPKIDNIYYNLYISNDYNGNVKLIELFDYLEELKNKGKEIHQPQKFNDELNVELIGFSIYKYCLSSTDLYDIFVADYLPNSSTPRIFVQVRAFGLWTKTEEEIIKQSYNSVKKIFGDFHITFDLAMENRIDYAYHTNAIHSPEKAFKDTQLESVMKTSLKRLQKAYDIQKNKKSEDKLALIPDYLFLGNRKSNNVVVRIYNKAKEVVDKGYKGFFINIWHENGLINFYDKFCFEKAYEEKKFNYIHRAKLEFYLEYGTNEDFKQEIKKILSKDNLTTEEIKDLADSHMPQLTTILNVEYETKRKFYYHSDDFIDTLQTKSNEITPLARLFRITDNKKIFLDYLTTTVLSFNASWWKRLQSTKLDSLKTNLKLLRNYNHELDERSSKMRLINQLATNSVLNDRLETDVEEDILDLMSNLNDNDIHAMKYAEKKKSKHSRLKNRLNKD